MYNILFFLIFIIFWLFELMCMQYMQYPVFPFTLLLACIFVVSQNVFDKFIWMLLIIFCIGLGSMSILSQRDMLIEYVLLLLLLGVTHTFRSWITHNLIIQTILVTFSICLYIAFTPVYVLNWTRFVVTVLITPFVLYYTE